jgi:hypothetical protein
MRLFTLALLLSLAACNPALNWRETRLDPSSLVALLPCKPDRGTRTVPLGGPPVVLHMAGCEAAGATFAVMVAQLDAAGGAGEALAGWKKVTLANMRARAVSEVPFQPAGALLLPESVRVTATGQRPDGQPVQAQAVWLARSSGAGVQIVHAVIYADAVPADVADTFFSGLRLP